MFGLRYDRSQRMLEAKHREAGQTSLEDGRNYLLGATAREALRAHVGMTTSAHEHT